MTSHSVNIETYVTCFAFFKVEKHEVEWLLEKYRMMRENNSNKRLPFVERAEFIAFLFHYFDMTDDVMMDRGEVIIPPLFPFAI